MTLDSKTVGASVPRGGNALTRSIGRIILKTMGWTINGKLPNRRQLIVIGGPHTSNWDLLLVLGTMLTLGLKFSWMMKKAAFIWPFGRLWKLLGGIPIDRNAQTGVIEQMKTRFQEGDSIWLGITPEGTRAKVETYKTGYLRLAIAVDVPLFIVGIDAPNKRIILDRLWHPAEDVPSENAAIKSYIESHYTGIRN